MHASSYVRMHCLSTIDGTITPLSDPERSEISYQIVRVIKVPPKQPAPLRVVSALDLHGH